MPTAKKSTRPNDHQYALFIPNELWARIAAQSNLYDLTIRETFLRYLMIGVEVDEGGFEVVRTPEAEH